MDYIECERHRLEIDLHVLTRRWHGTLSRMFVLRDRLDGIDPTDAEAFSRAANTLGAFANDATSLKRCVDKAKRRLASFDVDAQRQANADVLERLPEHVDYGRSDETGIRVVDWLNGMADPSPEIFEDWEAISLIRQNVYEDEPTGLADLLRSATRTERDECFDMLEQVETGRPL